MSGGGLRPERLPRRRRAQLDPDQRELHDRIVSGPRGGASSVPLLDEEGALLGPFAVMTVAPVVGDVVQEVGAALRFCTSLDALVREASILLVAVNHDCPFEWHAHAQAARDAGLSDEQLAVVRGGRVPAGVTAAQGAALRAIVALADTGRLDDGTFAAARDALGERGLAELVWLFGYYGMLATALAVFDATPWDA